MKYKVRRIERTVRIWESEVEADSPEAARAVNERYENTDPLKDVTTLEERVNWVPEGDPRRHTKVFRSEVD